MMRSNAERSTTRSLITGKALAAPWFYYNRIAIFEGTHMQLAGCILLPWAMCLSVDIHTAHTADTFPAVVVKSNGIFSFCGSVVHSAHRTFPENSFLKKYFLPGKFQNYLAHCCFLTPDFKREVHVIVLHM
jgi:hypothetical protein